MKFYDAAMLTLAFFLLVTSILSLQSYLDDEKRKKFPQ